MTVEEAECEYLNYIENVQMLSKNTVDSYRRDLVQFENFVGAKKQMHDISLDELRSCVGSLSRKGRAAASINRFIVSVHKLFSYCRKWGYIANNVSTELKSVKLPKRVPKFLTQREVDSICMQPAENPLLWEARDRAILELLYSTGCRVSEVSGLNVRDVSADHSSAMVTGKGSKDRRVFLEEDARNALEKAGRAVDAPRYCACDCAVFWRGRHELPRFSAYVPPHVCHVDAVGGRRCSCDSKNARTRKYFNNSKIHAHYD